MDRSLYILVYIYICIDLLLVALIISTGYPEGHAARFLQQAQFRLRIQIPNKFLDFAHFWSQKPRHLAPRHLKIALKSKPMALPKQSSYQGPPKVVIFSKFNGFWTSKSDPQIIKIRFENEVEKTIASGSKFGWLLKQFRVRKPTKKRPSWRKLAFTKKHIFAQ